MDLGFARTGRRCCKVGRRARNLEPTLRWRRQSGGDSHSQHKAQRSLPGPTAKAARVGLSRRVLTYIRPPSSSKAQLSSVTFYYPRNFHPFLVVYPCTMADLKKLNVLMCELIPALPPSVSTGKSPKLTASDAIEQVVQYVSTRVR